VREGRVDDGDRVESKTDDEVKDEKEWPVRAQTQPRVEEADAAPA
jgi:hypothetical protein